jgi:hypothetical protein
MWTRHEAALKCRVTSATVTARRARRDEPWVTELEVGPRALAAVATQVPLCRLYCWDWRRERQLDWISRGTGVSCCHGIESRGIALRLLSTVKPRLSRWVPRSYTGIGQTIVANDGETYFGTWPAALGNFGFSLTPALA